MKDKGTIEQQIKRLEKSIEKFGDHPKPGHQLGPKRKAILALQLSRGIVKSVNRGNQK